MAEKFAWNEFWRFCARLTINSKERGAMRLARPYGPQRWIIKKLAEGFDEDIHDFTILKCRQLGASTVFLALDLFWLFVHGGMDGTLVCQDETTFVNFRTQLGEFYRRLPRTYKPQSPTHNRNEFVFRLANGTMSRLQYQIAGTRVTESVKLGRAKGNSFCHGTEVAFWGDQSSFEVLKNSLAEANPARLYIWESTANGFNAFEEQWRLSQRAVTQRAIFVSWWAHEMYRIEKNDRRYQVYWGSSGRMTQEEARYARDVKLLYGDCLEYLYGTTELVPEQIAWYRWYGEEKTQDPERVKSEMPWTAETAFVTTGAQYFQSPDLTSAMRRLNGEPPPRYLRVEIAPTGRLMDTQIVEAPKKVCNLWIYEAPVEGGRYVLGADPAYGSSEWADAFAISVWRCWADRIEQVAEFCSIDFLPYSFAWVMVYLAGLYTPCAWNLEITGPGAAVLGEIDALKRQRFSGSREDRQILANFLGHMQEFLYVRFDSLNRNPVARGTQSTMKEKTRYMDSFKDCFARGIAVPHSKSLLDEMRWVVREIGRSPGGTDRHKDDRVVAAALAVIMWRDKIQPQQYRQMQTYAAEVKARAEGREPRAITLIDRIAQRQRQLLGLPQMKM